LPYKRSCEIYLLQTEKSRSPEHEGFTTTLFVGILILQMIINESLTKMLKKKEKEKEKEKRERIKKEKNVMWIIIGRFESVIAPRE
jgi:uncharacterized membrane protein